MTQHFGPHFLQIPGPSAIPDRVLRAISMPIIDHRGPEFAQLAQTVLGGIRRIFGTEHPVLIFPGSGTGAWESAVVNTLFEGDRVLMVETGHFASQWRRLTEKWGVETDFIPGDWRDWADPEVVREKLAADTHHQIRAVMVVHNETSTGVASPIKAIREAIDDTNHPALLMVDAISSLGSLPYEHDGWGVDVTVTCSQKGLMLPPGLAFVALSPRAIEQSRAGGMRRSYWDWSEMIEFNRTGFFPYTPATNLLYGLRESIAMIEEEGMANVFARHDRLAAATRAAVQAWGLEVLCANERAHSSVLTAVMMPDGHDADALRQHVLENFNLALGQGLSRLKGTIFRIGHLGQCNELVLLATLSGIEMGLGGLGIPHQRGGVHAAMDILKRPV
jgi:alanine-glyoxylate transaminase/serine-glyoxylate transaminase/serine-pyruvate transaminase